MERGTFRGIRRWLNIDPGWAVWIEYLEQIDLGRKNRSRHWFAVAVVLQRHGVKDDD